MTGAISFSPDLLPLIANGTKTITFRRSLYPPGVYAVNGGDLRIRITEVWWTRTEEHAALHFREEGFASPSEFLDFLARVYGKVPRSGFAHRFMVIE